MLLSVITFLIVFTVIILVHEMGHFLMARKAGIRVEEFGFGYPPRAFAKKIGKTILSLNWLPFGGFVRLLGEDLKEGPKKRKDYKEAFWYKSKKQRAIVLVSGVVANFLLAIVCFSIVYSVLGIPTDTDRVNIVGVLPETPAATVGIKENDVVLEVDEKKIENMDHFITLIDEKKGEEVGLLIAREGSEDLTFKIEPRENPPENEGSLGVIVTEVEIKKYPLWQMPFRGTVEGFKAAITLVGLVVSGLGNMVFNLFTQGQVPTGVAGPVGIMHMTGIVAHSGIIAVLQFTGLISVNLAIINILPFPALDGGRLVFIIYEAITRRRPKPSFEAWTNAAGMALLIVFLILVTVNDVKRIFINSDLFEKIKAILPF